MCEEEGKKNNCGCCWGRGKEPQRDSSVKWMGRKREQVTVVQSKEEVE